MTDDQIEHLARIVLINHTKLTIVADALTKLIDDLDSQGSLPEEYSSGAKVHLREQIRAALADQRIDAEALKRALGLE